MHFPGAIHFIVKHCPVRSGGHALGSFAKKRRKRQRRSTLALKRDWVRYTHLYNPSLKIHNCWREIAAPLGPDDSTCQPIGGNSMWYNILLTRTLIIKSEFSKWDSNESVKKHDSVSISWQELAFLLSGSPCWPSVVLRASSYVHSLYTVSVDNRSGSNGGLAVDKHPYCALPPPTGMECGIRYVLVERQNDSDLHFSMNWIVGDVLDVWLERGCNSQWTQIVESIVNPLSSHSENKVDLVYS